MCYHKSQTNAIDYLADYYSASYDDTMAELYAAHYHENAFDFLVSPIVTAEHNNQLLPYHWGLIPWWTKGLDAGLKLRVQTLTVSAKRCMTSLLSAMPRKTTALPDPLYRVLRVALDG